MANASKVLTRPVVIVGNHEPLIFRRRCGCAADEAERFAWEHSPEMVERLAARGVTWVRTHFFKGFGLAAEKEEIDQTAAFTELCHRYGINVELYTQFGTLQYETFLAEAPQCRDWVCVNPDGQLCSITYGHQNFRWRPCITKDGYWEYFRKVLDVAMNRVKADAFGFDNVGGPTEPESCHCPSCQAAFVGYLKAKYRPDTPQGAAVAKERFGFAVLDHITPPTFNRWNHPVDLRVIRDPVMQEWIQYRTDKLAQRFREIWKYVKAARPEMVIEYNVYGDFGCNDPYFNGSDMHKLLPWTEAFWDERTPYAPEYDPKTDHFWHRTHPYKLGQAYDAVVFSWHAGRDANQRKLALSECMAFNQGHLSGFGYSAAFAKGSYPEADEFITFRKEHSDLFEGTVSAAQVGVVEHSPSLSNNSIEPHYAEVLTLASLLAGHVPFDLIPEQTPETLKRYPVIVLPDLESMSDAEAGMYTGFVSAGGAVVTTRRTGMFDQWRRQRKENALSEMFRSAPGFEKFLATPAAKPAAKSPAGPILKGTFGNGRFVCLGQIEPITPFQASRDQWAIHTPYWQLPRNYRQFLAAIDGALAGAWQVEVTAPKGVAAEIRRTPKGKHVLHLVNYNLNRPAAAVLVGLRGLDATSATLWTPWDAEPRELRVRKEAGGARIAIGSLARYAIVEIS